MSSIVFLKIEKTGVTRVIPIVDNAEGESSRLVGEGEVYLMAVALMLTEGDVTPCGEGESFPSDGKLRLYGDMPQTKLLTKSACRLPSTLSCACTGVTAQSVSRIMTNCLILMIKIGYSY